MSNFRLANKNTGVSIQINSQGFVYDYQEPSYITTGDLVLIQREDEQTSFIDAVDLECFFNSNWVNYASIPMPNPYEAFQYYSVYQSGTLVDLNSEGGSDNFTECPPSPWYC